MQRERSLVPNHYNETAAEKYWHQLQNNKIQSCICMLFYTKAKNSLVKIIRNGDSMVPNAIWIPTGSCDTFGLEIGHMCCESKKITIFSP